MNRRSATRSVIETNGACNVVSADEVMCTPSPPSDGLTGGSRQRKLTVHGRLSVRPCCAALPSCNRTIVQQATCGPVKRQLASADTVVRTASATQESMQGRLSSNRTRPACPQTPQATSAPTPPTVHSAADRLQVVPRGADMVQGSTAYRRVYCTAEPIDYSFAPWRSHARELPRVAPLIAWPQCALCRGGRPSAAGQPTAYSGPVPLA